MSAGQLSPCSPKRSHLFFIGKLIERAVSQLFPNELKKYRRWTKKWIKQEPRTISCAAFQHVGLELCFKEPVCDLESIHSRQLRWVF